MRGGLVTVLHSQEVFGVVLGVTLRKFIYLTITSLGALLLLGAFQNCSKSMQEYSGPELQSSVTMSSTATTALTPSISGAFIPEATSLIDSQSNTWTMVSNKVYKNGVYSSPTANVNMMLYFAGVVYHRNTSLNWYKWSGTAWVYVGADPRTTALSASGASITTSGNLVDKQLHVWTNISGVIYEDGVKASTNSGIGIVLYYNGSVFVENTTVAAWYEWNGSSWIRVPADPRTMAVKSIKSYAAHCDGVTDDLPALTNAIAAAQNNAFVLQIDCPLKIHIGSDIAKTIFINNRTTIDFTSAGKIIVDNVMLPAFAIANSNNIALLNWNLEYDTVFPANWTVGGYYNNGVFVSQPTNNAPPAGAFNDLRMKPWLAANRAVVFNSNPTGGCAPLTNCTVSAVWVGPTNTSAVFFITGDSSNITVSGMTAAVPAGANADSFMPMVFNLSQNYKSSQTVTVNTPKTLQYFGLPHNLTFSNIKIDGSLMGWQGNIQNALFENITSYRYADLQDANGNFVGGSATVNGAVVAAKWFAPPHLFYINYNYTGDISLYTQYVTINNVVDYGQRVGVPRDTSSASISGCVHSLKIGGNQIVVTNYTSYRPDGFMQILKSDGFVMSNAKGSYNSAFIHDLYNGWLFPNGPDLNMTFNNVSITDTATTAGVMPISNNTGANSNLVFNGVSATVNVWGLGTSMIPAIYYQGTNSSIDYFVKTPASEAVNSVSNTVGVKLAASATAIKAGQSTTLTWSTTAATGCTASGSWSGAEATSGSKSIVLSTAGTYTYTMVCKNAADTSTASLSVVVSP